MTQNQFKPFATGANAIIQPQQDYENSIALKEGFRKGLARSNEVNKALRQATSIAAAVAGFTADKSEEDILDNGDIDTLQKQFETAIRTISTTLCAEAEGEADTLTATFTPSLKHLTSGKTVLIRANQKNTSKPPSFQADQTGAKKIIKGNNLPLEEGDIAGAGHWLELQYDSHLDKWVLQNPAKGISPLNGVPVGTVEYFAMPTPPAGYLKADGREVGRETYPELYTAIGTTFGEGDGATSFNLPDLIDRFAQGSSTPGEKVSAGLPNIEGRMESAIDFYRGNGAFFTDTPGTVRNGGPLLSSEGVYINIDASRSNPIYGASDTVQPPALTLLPCIKAFDAATNPGLIDITGLANEVDKKLDRVIDSKPVRYVIDAYNDGTAYWYRKWSDGWLEQGSQFTGSSGTVNLIVPFLQNSYTVTATLHGSDKAYMGWCAPTISQKTATSFYLSFQAIANTGAGSFTYWDVYACGQGA